MTSILRVLATIMTAASDQEAVGDFHILWRFARNPRVQIDGGARVDRINNSRHARAAPRLD